VAAVVFRIPEQSVQAGLVVAVVVLLVALVHQEEQTLAAAEAVEIPAAQVAPVS
jgi:hypothetical protein